MFIQLQYIFDYCDYIIIIIISVTVVDEKETKIVMPQKNNAYKRSIGDVRLKEPVMKSRRVNIVFVNPSIIKIIDIYVYRCMKFTNKKKLKVIV